MNRRDALRSLAGTGAALTLEGCTKAPAQPGPPTDDDIERVALALTGVGLKPGQAAGVREMLRTMRFNGTVDPAVQPSLIFDPEVDIE
jgi:hypothetical protein